MEENWVNQVYQSPAIQLPHCTVAQRPKVRNLTLPKFLKPDTGLNLESQAVAMLVSLAICSQL